MLWEIYISLSFVGIELKLQQPLCSTYGEKGALALGGLKILESDTWLDS